MNTMPVLEEGADRLLPLGPAAQLARLNRAYLGLIASDPGCRIPLSSPVLAALRAAAPRTLDAMAACCYALFALDPVRLAAGFIPASTAVHDPMDGQYGPAGPGAAWRSFAMEAVAFAWTLGRQNPLSSHLMLGLSGPVASALSELDPWSLGPVAIRQPLPLPPRWHSNRCFWPDLVMAASTGDALKLDLARLLGLQLFAADMQSTRVGRMRGCDSLRAP